MKTYTYIKTSDLTKEGLIEIREQIIMIYFQMFFNIENGEEQTISVSDIVTYRHHWDRKAQEASQTVLDYLVQCRVDGVIVDNVSRDEVIEYTN